MRLSAHALGRVVTDAIGALYSGKNSFSSRSDRYSVAKRLKTAYVLTFSVFASFVFGYAPSLVSDNLYQLVYLSYGVDFRGKKCWFDDDVRAALYPTYEECFRAASGEEASKFRIKKRYIGGKEGIELDLLPDGTVLSVSASGKEEGITTAFDWFWVKLPTPFRRGDILRSVAETACGEELFVVLESISVWGGKELAENGFVDCGKKPNPERKRNELDFAAWDRLAEYHKEDGDVSDMNLEGYEVTPNGEILWDTHVTYLDFERCSEVPENRKTLFALSAFMKGKISEDLLLNAYRYHALGAARLQTEDLFPLYTKERLAAAGIFPDQSRGEQNSEGDEDEA